MAIKYIDWDGTGKPPPPEVKPIATCPTCNKEWNVPRSFSKSSHSVVSCRAKKGKKTKVICPECREKRRINENQVFQYNRDRTEILEDIENKMRNDGWAYDDDL